MFLAQIVNEDCKEEGVLPGVIKTKLDSAFFGPIHRKVGLPFSSMPYDTCRTAKYNNIRRYIFQDQGSGSYYTVRSDTDPFYD